MKPNSDHDKKVSDLNYKVFVWLFRKQQANLTDGLEVDNTYSIEECDKMIRSLYSELEYMETEHHE